MLCRTRKCWKKNLKRKTYKRRNIYNMEEFPELLNYGSNEYLGNGSYGFVYIIPGYSGRYVLKQHLITNDVNNTDSINSNNSINNTKKKTVCDSWIQEYNMHKYIYNTCNHLLTPLAISIVKPHSFSYGLYDGNTLKRLPNDDGMLPVS